MNVFFFMTFKSFDGSCSVADLSFYSKATDDNFFGDGKCHSPFPSKFPVCRRLLSSEVLRLRGFGTLVFIV